MFIYISVLGENVSSIAVNNLSRYELGELILQSMDKYGGENVDIIVSKKSYNEPVVLESILV